MSGSKSSFIWESKGDNMLRKEISVDTTLLRGDHILYTITVPLSDCKATRIYNSQKIILRVV